MENPRMSVTEEPTSPGGAAAAPAPGVKKGHPKGLYILFFTEMWERMSYYGMRALLVLYMTDYLFKPERAKDVFGFNAVRGVLEAIFGPLAIQPLSSQIYGLYTGFVYATPILGGILADRLLGQRKTVILGGVIMSIGHFLMASERLFFPALLCLVIGNGAFKPNLSTQVGLLYEQGDPRRDRAFNIYYVGINLGAFLAPLVCGTLGQKVGWHYGFGAAGVGMILGLIVYMLGQKHLAPDNLMKQAAGPGGAAAAEKTPITSEEKGRILALVVLCVLNIVFWAVYEQQGNTMQIWADKQTHWPTILGFQIPSTWFQSFNPAMIFTFTPLINILWTKQAREGKEPSSVMKMAYGCSILGLSFIVMILAAQAIGPEGKGSMIWPFACTAMLTVGELYLSPVGLSLVTKLAPGRMVSMLMGMWFLSNFFGNYLSGYIGTFYEKWPKESFFLLLTVMGVGAGLAIFAISRWLRRIMGAHANA
jgi:POT family proton-dependent oligopeptide transporter